MKYRCFGRQGFECSEVGFGGWAIGGGWGAQADADSMAALRRALELGCNFIDTAAGYGDGHSERLIARALRDRRATGARLPVYVATKIPPLPGEWPPSPYDLQEDRYPEDFIRRSLEARLANLETDRIDLLQLHTWTRAWNDDPAPLRVLRELQREGRIGLVGVSAPEHDQDSVVDLMRAGWVDAVQVIYNLFEQEPTAQLLKEARRTGVAVIVRVVFDEGALTGRFSADTHFAQEDFRARYFAGDRLARVVARVAEIRKDLALPQFAAECGQAYTMAQAALKWVLAHPAVSTVIPGIRTAAQAEANCAVSELPDMSAALVERLRRHNWRRGIWYGGK
ncbi:MAG: aldo/keto reductase [Opitutaceae bacterium]|nr:aldo/keto reductase [Opitutaceae bacterium]